MAARHGLPRSSSIPLNGMPGGAGKSTGSRRRSRGHTPSCARAKDANGCVQPDRHDPNYGSYVINHPLPIEVLVDDRGS